MRAILCGACGRMGRQVAELAGEKIVCGVDLLPSPMPFPVHSSFAAVDAEADVVIDFSAAAGIGERLNDCVRRGLPVVLAATGYTKDDLLCIAEAAKTIAVFRSGNFSVGVSLLRLLAKRAAAVLGEEFDVEIVERHHNRKKDAPSGTALMLAESVREGRRQPLRAVCGREGLIGERAQDEIGIHAVRGGTIVGEHEVMFAGQDEIVTLSHSARSRKIFASGALRAAEWLIGRAPGEYDMDDLLAGVL